MRILHVIHQYFPDHVGGTEHYVRTLAWSQMQKGHQVTLFCRRSGSGQHLDLSEEPFGKLRADSGESGGSSGGIQVYQAVNGPFSPIGRFHSTLGDRFLAGCLSRTIAEVQPDLVHIHHLMGLPVKALMDTDLAPPLVVTLHDYWWVCANAQLITDYDRQVCDGPRWWLNCARCGLARAGASAGLPQALSPLVAPLFARRAALLRGLVPRVAAWIAPTAFVANWHSAHGLPTERMHIVGHGIELPPEDAVQAPKVSLGQNGQPANNFAYIGGLAHQKGVHILIDAFNELPSSARLTIAGDETAFPDYCAFLRTRATHPGIDFIGRLDREGVWQNLNQTDVLVVPSLWYETSSLVVQEAFATGTPVVAAGHGALAERVHHGTDGLLTPPDDVLELRCTLQRLMDEPALLTQLQSGIKPVMDMAQHERQTEQVYRQVLVR